MSIYKSKFSGKQIDDAVDALSKVASYMVQQPHTPGEKYMLEVGKTYLIRNTSAVDNWGMDVTMSAYSTNEVYDPGVVKTSRLSLPKYDKHSTGVKIKLLEVLTNIDTNEDDDGATGTEYYLGVEYDAAPDNLIEQSQRYYKPDAIEWSKNGVYGAIPDFFDSVKYEIFVTGATEIFICNDDAPTIYGAPGDSAFIRYSAYSDGTDFVDEWSAGLNYMGFTTGQIAPTDKNAYTWVPMMTTNKDGDVIIHTENKIRIEADHKDIEIVRNGDDYIKLSSDGNVWKSTSPILITVGGGGDGLRVEEGHITVISSGGADEVTLDYSELSALKDLAEKYINNEI